MVVKKFVNKVLFVLLVVYGIYFAIIYFHSDNFTLRRGALSTYFTTSDYRSNLNYIRDDPKILERAIQVVKSDIYKDLHLDKLIENKRDETLNHDEREFQPVEKKVPEYTDIQAAKKAFELEDIKHTGELTKPEAPQKAQDSPEKQLFKPVVAERNNELDPQGTQPSEPEVEGNKAQPKEAPKTGAGAKVNNPTIQEHVKSEIGVKGEAPIFKEAPKLDVGTKEADTPIKDSQQQHEGGKQLTWAETAYSESRNFQAADGVSLFVYSAYWDADNHIRCFGIVERVNYHPKLTCHLWATNPPGKSEIYNTADTGIVIIPEHHNKKYSAGYVICRLPPGVAKQNPLLVSLSVEREGKRQNTTLLIHQREKWRSNFTLCVPPLFNGYNRVGIILEMIELNRILGATKFFFYDFDIGPGVKEVLNHYQRKGIVEIINWSLPTKTLAIGGTGRGMDIFYFGQLSAMNDCVYRNRYQSDYVVLTDLDEFVVPNITSNMSTWGELISHRKKVNPDFSVFWIRTVFFRLEWVRREDLVFQKGLRREIFTVLSARYREDEWCDYGDKSKNIVDPLGVKIVGIHNIWEKAGPRDLVPAEEATLLHYRSKVYPEDPRKRIRDEMVLNRFGSDLIKHTQRVWTEIVKSRAPR